MHDGLPSEKYLKHWVNTYREQGLKLAEFGKFVNVSHGGSYLAKLHHRAIYKLARGSGVDVVIMVAPQKCQSLYVKWIGAKVLIDDIQESFGGDQRFSAYA